MTLFGDVLKAIEDGNLPLHVAVQLAEPDALEAAWESDKVADLLGVRFRLGLTPRDNAALVAMVARMIDPPPWGSDSRHVLFILDRLRAYLAAPANMPDLGREIVQYRANANVSNWTHPAEAAYHITMVITARDVADRRTSLTMMWHVIDGLSLVRQELSNVQKLDLDRTLREDLQMPTAAEIFAATVGERRADVVW